MAMWEPATSTWSSSRRWRSSSPSAWAIPAGAGPAGLPGGAGAVGKDKAHLKLAVSDAARGRTLEGRSGFTWVARRVLPHLSRRALVDIAFVPRRQRVERGAPARAAGPGRGRPRRWGQPLQPGRWTLEEEIAAAGESPALSTAVAGRTAGSGARPPSTRCGGPCGSGRWSMPAGAALGPLVEELRPAGTRSWPSHEGPGLSLDLARRLAEHSPRVRERTFLWSVALSPSLRELVCRPRRRRPGWPWWAPGRSWNPAATPSGTPWWSAPAGDPPLRTCPLPPHGPDRPLPAGPAGAPGPAVPGVEWGGRPRG